MNGGKTKPEKGLSQIKEDAWNQRKKSSKKRPEAFKERGKKQGETNEESFQGDHFKDPKMSQK